jgi:hypothetical protein
MRLIAKSDFSQGPNNPLGIPGGSQHVKRGTIFSIGGDLPREKLSRDDQNFLGGIIHCVCDVDSDEGGRILKELETSAPSAGKEGTMAEIAGDAQLKFKLGPFGGEIIFSTPDELKNVATNEWNAWAWIESNSYPQIINIVNNHKQLKASLTHYADEWSAFHKSPNLAYDVLKKISQTLTNYYIPPKIFHSSSLEARFLSDLRERSGPVTSAGAYAGLLANTLVNPSNDPQFYQGMFDAFLFRRGADWNADAQLKALEELSSKYKNNIEEQEKVGKENVERNSTLLKDFTDLYNNACLNLETLTQEKKTALNGLHEQQSNTFQEIIDKHVKDVKAIETTYDQKLALQKPVEYWNTKEVYHGKWAKYFGFIALGTGAVLSLTVGGTIYYVIGTLTLDGSPKSWQIGVCLIALFFSIWIIRILVRLFLSHSHLKGDAAERKTMILTYLSMAREGSTFAPEDKQLILQHIFRSTSDGLVKDDGAPATPLEILSRLK